MTDDEATALREYGMRCAQTYRDSALAEIMSPSCMSGHVACELVRFIEGLDLAAIVASVEVPKQQPEPVKLVGDNGCYWPVQQPPESAPTSDGRQGEAELVASVKTRRIKHIHYLATEEIEALLNLSDEALRGREVLAAADAAGYLRGEVAGLQAAEKVCDGLIREGSRVTHPGAGVVRVEIRALIAAAQSKVKP